MPVEDPVVLNNLAWIYMTEGDQRAEETARRANAAAPNSPDIMDTLGWILLNKGENDEALTLLKSAARALPENAEVLYHLGKAFFEAGQKRRAREALQKSVAIGGFVDLGDAQALLSELGS